MPASCAPSCLYENEKIHIVLERDSIDNGFDNLLLIKTIVMMSLKLELSVIFEIDFGWDWIAIERGFSK